jgi:hypothetical protein
MAQPPIPEGSVDRNFRVLSLDFSRYFVDMDDRVRGELLLMHVPLKVFEIPRDRLPPGSPEEPPAFAVHGQTMVTFVNYGRKGPAQSVNPGELKYVDITHYVVKETELVPWNEFLVVGVKERSEGLILRLRILLTKLEVAEGKYEVRWHSWRLVVRVGRCNLVLITAYRKAG